MTADRSDCRIHLVGHAHIDLAYRWRWNEVVHRVGPATFDGVLKLKDGPSVFSIGLVVIFYPVAVSVEFQRVHQLVQILSLAVLK